MLHLHSAAGPAPAGARGAGPVEPHAGGARGSPSPFAPAAGAPGTECCRSSDAPAHFCTCRCPQAVTAPGAVGVLSGWYVAALQRMCEVVQRLNGPAGVARFSTRTRLSPATFAPILARVLLQPAPFLLPCPCTPLHVLDAGTPLLSAHPSADRSSCRCPRSSCCQRRCRCSSICFHFASCQCVPLAVSATPRTAQAGGEAQALSCPRRASGEHR